MKYVLMTAIVVALAGCRDERPSTESVSGNTYRVECIDSVQYWIIGSGNSQMMTARVDPKTLTFVRCEGN
jgi:hypothetical protein